MARKLEQRTCRICENNFIGNVLQTLCKSKECRYKAKKEAMSKESTKKLLSEKRSQYIKEHPDTLHWKTKDKFKSKPCELVKEFLRSKNIQFVEEWTPLEDRGFSIDIAFPDIKFGIEVNGGQHYKSDGTLKPYYQERHDLIEAAGWQLLEVHYSSCYNTAFIEKLIDIKEQPDYTQYFQVLEERKKIRESKQNIVMGKRYSLEYENNQKSKYEQKHKEQVEIIKKCNVDFSKLGWIEQVADLIGLSHTSTKRLMIRLLPEIYNNAYHKGTVPEQIERVKNKKEKTQSNKDKHLNQIEEMKQRILTSKINLQKYGGGTKLAKELGITKYSLYGFLHRHLPEFFEKFRYKKI